jgi:predicted nucleotidyltransferase
MSPDRTLPTDARAEPARPDGRRRKRRLGPNQVRLEIARRCVERKRRELGEAMLAAAVYGSVAHRAAAEHSDVEVVVVVVDASVDERDEHFFDAGVMVECSLVDAERMLASARRVPWNWGIKADAYRHQEPIWDPGSFFQRLREAARSIPDDDFERALEHSWWILYEGREKLRNAVAADDAPRAVYLGWEYAYSAAMRIALTDRKPYESARTLWRDATSRGYGMAALIEALTAGARARADITSAVDDVWRELGSVGVPSSARGAP